MGGSDDASNLINLSIEDHAEAHRILYEEHGCPQDKLAWQALSGQINSAEIADAKRRLPKSNSWKMKMSKRNSGSGNPMFGKKQGDKQKAAVSKARKGVPNPNVGISARIGHEEGRLYQITSENNPRKTKVSINGVIYETIKIASDSLGMNYSKLRDRLNSKSFTTYFRV